MGGFDFLLCAYVSTRNTSVIRKKVVIFWEGKKGFTHEFSVAFKKPQHLLMWVDSALSRVTISEWWQEDTKYHVGLWRSLSQRQKTKKANEIRDKHSQHTFKLGGEQRVPQVPRRPGMRGNYIKRSEQRKAQRCRLWGSLARERFRWGVEGRSIPATPAGTARRGGHTSYNPFEHFWRLTYLY